MKNVLLAAVLAAVLASAATLLVAESLRPAAPPAEGPALAALRASLEETRRELAAVRAASVPISAASARDAAAGAPGGAASPGGGSVAGEARDGKTWAEAPNEAMDVAVARIAVAQEVEVARPKEVSAIPRAAEVLERLRAMPKWDDNADLRKTWTLASESEVLDSFGKPDFIYMQDSGSECWNYRFPSGTTDEDGNQEWDEITLELNRGRLIRSYD